MLLIECNILWEDIWIITSFLWVSIKEQLGFFFWWALFYEQLGLLVHIEIGKVYQKFCMEIGVGLLLIR